MVHFPLIKVQSSLLHSLGMCQHTKQISELKFKVITESVLLNLISRIIVNIWIIKITC